MLSPFALPRITLVLLLLAFVSQPQRASAQSLGEVVQVEVIAESDTPQAGKNLTIALVMTPAKGWHGYWKNPGDAGTEATIAWKLPAGVTAGPIQYPVPSTLLIGGLMNYVYERPYALLVDLRLPARLASGTALPVRGRFDFLACTEEICVPQTRNLAITLKVGRPGQAQTLRADFDRYRQALPKPLGAAASFEQEADRWRMAIPMPADVDVEDPYFFPLTDGALDYAAPQQVSRNGDMLIVETKAGSQPPPRVEGVLRIGEGNGLTLSGIPGPVPPAGDPIVAEPESQGHAIRILAALLGAIVGGLLLNVMPCVFPILSLKALSLAKIGGDEREARREALAYAAGAVLICLALGSALLALRAAGVAAGWAFQLQDPRVILVLLLLVTAIALNLAGLFELPQLSFASRPAQLSGATGAFWTGALAAFVATPCTGPFMGAAMGAALVLPTVAALAVFGGLGLGLALPFLLLGFVPALRRKLPRPGTWMTKLRHVLSLPMFVTALALAWILGRQSGVNGMAIGLAGALLLGLGLWGVGRRQGRERAWLPLAPVLLASLAALVLLPANDRAAASPREADGVLTAEPFSEARLAALRSEGKPVFVYFTADWCLTCKVNEKTAIDRAEVAKSFEAAGVAVLVGDWTNGDAAIGRFLERHGRSGVPLYLFYRPGQPPEVLPQLLTAGTLTSLTT